MLGDKLERGPSSDSGEERTGKVVGLGSLDTLATELDGAA